jgi:hypothetical protein
MSATFGRAHGMPFQGRRYFMRGAVERIYLQAWMILTARWLLTNSQTPSLAITMNLSFS